MASAPAAAILLQRANGRLFLPDNRQLYAGFMVLRMLCYLGGASLMIYGRIRLIVLALAPSAKCKNKRFWWRVWSGLVSVAQSPLSIGNPSTGR
ncbi:hypothetical protein KCP70_14385 [Salmonella enterica subsp. enterica]|nr:hypothetical protein KCP70_14385 [Salmonella enterica subsp. enterica]